MEALRQLITASMAGKEIEMYTIEYQDTEGDKIAVLDDEDLLLAYEWAQEEANGNLKLMITAQAKQGNESQQISSGSSKQLRVDPINKTEDNQANDMKMSSSSGESDDEKQPQNSA